MEDPIILSGGDTLGGVLYGEFSSQVASDYSDCVYRLYVWHNGRLLYNGDEYDPFSFKAGTFELIRLERSWAVYCPNGTSMMLQYEVKEFERDANFDTTGNASTMSTTCTIPDNEYFRPSGSVTLSDPMGYLEKYGAFLQELSTIKIDLEANGMWGATIKTCEVQVNGQRFTSSESAEAYTFTTNLVQASSVDSETRTVDVTLTDSRGYSSQFSYAYTVRMCPRPVVTSLSVWRCNADGTENDRGEYVGVNFSAVVTSLDGLNSAAYKIQYKKTTAANYTDVPLPAYNDVYEVTDHTYIFAADTGSVYNVRVVVTDDYGEITRETTASAAFTIMHFGASGYSMGLGKVTELDEGLDLGFRTRHDGGLLHPILTATTDLDNVKVPNTYAGLDASTAKYVNCPISDGAFVLEVLGAGAEDLMRVQRLTTCLASGNKSYERRYYKSGTAYAWSAWEPTIGNLVEEILGKVYPVGSIYMSMQNVSPASFVGGSWAKIGGRFLWGEGTPEANTHDMFGNLTAGAYVRWVGERGGEYGHTITVDEMPSHGHHYYANIQHGDGTVVEGVEALTSGIQVGGRRRYADATEPAGGGNKMWNMPPYVVVYMWERTA